MNVISWLLRNRNETCTEATVVEAASEGYLPVLVLLATYSPVACTRRALEGAIKGEHHYTAAWIAHTYPKLATPAELRHMGLTAGWNDAILRAVFRV